MMKKKILFALLGLLLVGLALLVWQGVKNDVADVSYEKTFTLAAQDINTIRISSLEQPAKVTVRETEAEESSVHISGQLAQNNIDAMEELFAMDKDGDLYISFAKEGLMMTVMGEKPTVTIDIALAKDVIFKDFDLFSSNGGAEISLPPSFDGIYKLKSKGGEKKQPQDGNDKKRQAKVEVTGDINIYLK